MSDISFQREPASHAPEMQGARAAVRRLLVALVKLALVDVGSAPARWSADALHAQQQVADAITTPHTLPLDPVWASAVQEAERDPVVRRDETVNPMLPTMSPLSLEQLATTPFDLAGAVQTIRDAASFG